MSRSERHLRHSQPWNYRNKMQFPIGLAKGNIVVGCFAQGSHTIIDTENCHIQREPNNALANAVRAIAAQLRIPVYNEDTHKGILRHIVGRVGQNGDLMAVIVTATKQLPRAKDFVRLLRERLPNLVSVHQNIQTYRNNVIMGRDTVLLWGKPTILDALDGCIFHISPRSFFFRSIHSRLNVSMNRHLPMRIFMGQRPSLTPTAAQGQSHSFLPREHVRSTASKSCSLPFSMHEECPR